MDIFTGIIVFILVWWVVIYTVLPWGNQPVSNPEIGHAPSAPANTRLKKKLIITTLISLVITAIIILTIHYSDFSFRQMVHSWSME